MRLLRWAYASPEQFCMVEIVSLERRPVNLTHSDEAIFAPDQAAFPEDSGAI